MQEAYSLPQELFSHDIENAISTHPDIYGEYLASLQIHQGSKTYTVDAKKKELIQLIGNALSITNARNKRKPIHKYNALMIPFNQNASTALSSKDVEEVFENYAYNIPVTTSIAGELEKFTQEGIITKTGYGNGITFGCNSTLLKQIKEQTNIMNQPKFPHSIGLHDTTHLASLKTRNQIFSDPVKPLILAYILEHRKFYTNELYEEFGSNFGLKKSHLTGQLTKFGNMNLIQKEKHTGMGYTQVVLEDKTVKLLAKVLKQD